MPTPIIRRRPGIVYNHPLLMGANSVSGTRGTCYLLFALGALSVSYRIPFEGELSTLHDLSAELYENPLLLAESRRRAEELVGLGGPAIERAGIADHVEAYVVYHLDSGF